MNTLPNLMQELVGFFIIEAHVLKSVSDFRSQRDVDDLWDEMCRRIIGVVSQGLKGCSQLNVFLESKMSILLFVQTLEVGLATCPKSDSGRDTATTLPSSTVCWSHCLSATRSCSCARSVPTLIM
jgi:hypothetical protein